MKTGIPTPEGQMLQQAGHSVAMIRSLPAYAAEDANAAPNGDVRVACLEAFLMHVRAMADFFCCRQAARVHPTDFSARTFVADWEPAPGDAVKRLAEVWVIASRLIAHFTEDRLQLGPEPEFHDMSRAALDRIASDVEAMWTAFNAARVSPASEGCG